MSTAVPPPPKQNWLPWFSDKLGLTGIVKHVLRAGVSAAVEEGYDAAKKKYVEQEPSIKRGISQVNTLARQALSSAPPPLKTFNQELTPLTSKAADQITQEDVNPLLQKMQEAGLDEEQSDTLQEKFPKLKPEEADTLVQLHAQLTQFDPFACPSPDLPQLIAEAHRITSEYDTQRELALHQVIWKETDERLNTRVSQAMDVALDSLEAMHDIEPADTAEEKHTARRNIIIALEPLIAREQKLTNSEKLAIVELMEYLDQFEDQEISDTDLDAFKEHMVGVSRILSSKNGIVPRTFRTAGNQARNQGKKAIKNMTSYAQVHLPPLVSHLVDHAVSYTSSAVTGAVDSLINSSAASSADGGNSRVQIAINTIVEKGQQIFASILSKMKNAASKYAAISLTKLLTLVCKGLQDHLQKNPSSATQKLIAQMQTCIDDMTATQNSSSMEEICNALKAAFSALRNQEIYVQGFRLPLKMHSSVSATSELLELVKGHEEALGTQERQEVTEAMIDAMFDKLKLRSTLYLTTSISVQDILGVNPDTLWSLIEGENPSALDPGPFRVRLFKYIDETPDKPFYKKLLAKAMYYFLTGFVSFYVDSIVEGMKEDFLSLSKKNTSTKAKEVVGWLRDWLAKLSGAYTEVAQTPPERIKDIFLLLNEAIRVPSRNGGLRTEQFYSALLKTLMKFVGFRWTKSIDRIFRSNRIPPSSQFSALNPLLNAFNFTCRNTLKFFLFIPQSIVNFFLQKASGFLLSKSGKLPAFANAYLEKFNHAKSHISFSVQRIVFAKLREIAKLVQTRLNGPDEEKGQPPTQDQYAQISSCLEVLLEVLPKSQKSSVDSLKQYVQDNLSIREKVKKELVDFFLPEAMPAVAMTLWTAVSGAVGEKDLHRLFYDILCVADNSFKPHPEVTEEQVRALEKGIAAETEAILESMIFYLLDKKFNISNTAQQQKTADFVGALKKGTRDFTHRLQDLQMQLARFSSGSPQCEEILKKMNALSTEFLNSRMAEIGKAEGNPHLHSETKKRLNELETQKNSRHISTSIDNMMHAQNQVNAHELAADAIAHALSALGNSENSKVFNTAATLAQQLARLRSADKDASAELDPLSKQLKVHEEQLEKTHVTSAALREIDALWNSYAMQKRSNPLIHTAEIISWQQRLNALISPLSEPHRTELIASLSASAQAQDAGTLENEIQRFSHHLGYATRENENFLQQAQNQFRQTKGRMESQLNQLRQRTQQKSAEKRKRITDENVKLRNYVHTLGTWEKGVQDIPFYDIVFFDHMQWINEMTHAIAMWRVKAFAAEIQGMFVHRHMYESLVLHFLLTSMRRLGPEFLLEKR